MKTKCFSVKLKSMEQITANCFKAVAYDGSEAFIPAQFVYGEDKKARNNNAWWIAAWILEKKDLQYSGKKAAWFDDNGNQTPHYTITKHTATKIDKEVIEHQDLKKC